MSGNIKADVYLINRFFEDVYIKPDINCSVWKYPNLDLCLNTTLTPDDFTKIRSIIFLGTKVKPSISSHKLIDGSIIVSSDAILGILLPIEIDDVMTLSNSIVAGLLNVPSSFSNEIYIGSDMSAFISKSRTFDDMKDQSFGDLENETFETLVLISL